LKIERVLKRAKKRRTRVKPNALMALRAPLTTGAPLARPARARNGELRRENIRFWIFDLGFWIRWDSGTKITVTTIKRFGRTIYRSISCPNPVGQSGTNDWGF
jgi:hypothetical protein